MTTIAFWRARNTAKANLEAGGRHVLHGAFRHVPEQRRRHPDAISTGGRGDAWRPCWALVANHYINRKASGGALYRALPNWWHRKAAAATTAPTVAASISLATARSLASLDPGTPAATPTGSTGYASAGKAVLSWAAATPSATT